MDDLLGEDWQSAPKQSITAAKSPNPSSFASSYSSFRASPQPVLSGTGSPLNLSRPSSTVTGGHSKPSSKPSTPSNDAFGNLTAFKSQKTEAGLSIQEKQRQLVEERRRQQEEQGRLWDTLGSGRSSAAKGQSAATAAAKIDDDEDDILAAFNKDAKVDASSHFPPMGVSSGATSGRSTPALTLHHGPERFDEDDDPFGLNEIAHKSNGHANAPRHITPVAEGSVGDDDILGDLGKPVSEKRKIQRQETEEEDHEWDENIAQARSKRDDAPKDRNLAELVEMGFPADTAKIALAENGGNVQSAVGWLLQQAHEESRQKARGESQPRRVSPGRNGTSPRRRERRGEEATPSWMREEARSSSGNRRQGSQATTSNGEKDATQMAQDLGNKLFKSANSLWKASQKQMARTMADFQQERDQSQPKWMQSSSNENSSRESSQRRTEQKSRAQPVQRDNVTDEAALLDMPRDPRTTRSARSDTPVERRAEVPIRSRAGGDAPVQRAHARPVQQQTSASDRRVTSKLSRQDVEEQSAQAYVSPARRKRVEAAKAEKAAEEKKKVEAEAEVDLFSPAPAVAPAVAKVSASRTPVAPSPRPQAPSRTLPPASAAALSTSANHRKKGTEAFKRGDYAAAHESYTAALTPLPATHPIVIVVLSNRALTALKTGDPKAAISDADRALEVIGTSLGVGESIDMGNGEGSKEMREFYGKAVMRKAEALEHMEKWQEAGSVWRQAVSAGIGGGISISGKERCERASAPAPVTRVAAAATPRPSKNPSSAKVKARPVQGLGNSLQRPTIATPESAEAVKRLREANAAAEKADDEKFQLADQVEARLTAWKGGKSDNLRALLQSLDTVLWEGAAWKKVGMSDLVMVNKVKIIYMKAIAKVHPDKISQEASTEQRMISGAVFSTLNEAWDKFKADNNL